MNIPEPQSSFLEKTVSDVCTLSVNIVGKKATVTGNSKNITTAWKEYSATGDNTGHFAVLQLPASFVGKDVTIKGAAKPKTVKGFDADRILITRLENLTNGKVQTFEIGGAEVLTVDYSGVTLDP